MPFDWKSLIELARRMEIEAAQDTTRAVALLRSAVSRAYFSAFCYARDYAHIYLKYQPKNDERDHGSLRAHLKGKRRQGDAERLERLRQWRNDADYLNELPWQDTKTVVAAAIADAERVFASLTPPAQPASS